MRYLEERGKGFRVRRWRVPIVGAAVLMDLGIGDGRVRPGAEQGHTACLNASAGAVAQGSVGAGTGATACKALGPKGIVKGGLGSASTCLADGTVVGAIVAVNAFGEVVEHATGRVVAGPRKPDGSGFASTLEALKQGRPGFAAVDVYEEEPVTGGNHPLLKMPNVICTPHLGYVEKSTYENYYGTVIDSILGFASGKPVNVLNPEVLGKN